MNLHAIAGPIVAAVNPSLPVTLLVSTGSTIVPGGTRVPTYAAPVTVQAQVQALTFRDITQVSGLNLQGTRRAIYLLGDVEGLVRSQGKGGDKITFPDGSVWLVAMVLEAWGATGSSDTWVKVAATLQDGS